MTSLWEDLSHTFNLFESQFRRLFPAPPHFPELWRSVFTHSSFTYEHPDSGPSYERLEFLGDALLYAATSLVLYQRFSHYAEDALSFMRTTLIRKEVLAQFAREHGLEHWVRLGKAARSLDPQGMETIYADIAEAFLGAFYLEFGWSNFIDFVERHLFLYLPGFEEARRNWDPKSVLQEKLARLKEPPPRYEVVGRLGGETRVRLLLKEHTFDGKGRNRKEAEADAARQALNFLDQLDGEA